MEKNFYHQYFDLIRETLKGAQSSDFARAADLILSVKNRNGKILLVGNGGSAAIAAHVAVDITKNLKIKAMTFNEADLITCFANDFGHENWMAQALEHYAEAKDLVILISSSGQSKNILNAADTALKLKLNLWTLSGFKSDNPLRKKGQLNFWAESDQYNIVEMTHHIWLLAVVDELIQRK